MFKNPSLKQIAFYVSVAVSLIGILIFLFQEYIFSGVNPLYNAAAFFVTTMFTTYVLVLLGVKLFVHERIKIIYKYIHNVKRAGINEKQSIFAGNDAIDQVEKDVSDYVEERDQEIQTLKALENYRREFLGTISHELKTPIFNIQGYIHTLIEGGLYDKNINLDYLHRAANNTKRLSVIVENLTEISRLESGELQFEFEEFDIRNLVEEVYKDQEFLTKKKNISLVFNDARTKSFEVVADRESVRQVLTNLITNAVKYNNEDGRVKASFYQMGQNVLIEIADNGPGIEEKHLPHLFDRFYRADGHRSREVGGSGLGLSIVKHIIEAHKQTIHVRSTMEVGTTFGFTLKRSPK